MGNRGFYTPTNGVITLLITGDGAHLVCKVAHQIRAVSQVAFGAKAASGNPDGYLGSFLLRILLRIRSHGVKITILKPPLFGENMFEAFWIRILYE